MKFILTQTNGEFPDEVGQYPPRYREVEIESLEDLIAKMGEWEKQFGGIGNGIVIEPVTEWRNGWPARTSESPKFEIEIYNDYRE